jgi:hypothetical protein
LAAAVVTTLDQCDHQDGAAADRAAGGVSGPQPTESDLGREQLAQHPSPRSGLEKRPDCSATALQE